MKILVLTDHATHTDQNSFYGIANALFHHEDVSEVHVATRGDVRNRFFFRGEADNGVFGRKMYSDLSFIQFPGWIESAELCDPHNFDIILLRVPRPVPDKFFELLINNYDEKRIINRPSGIKETSSKYFLLELAPWCPPIEKIENWESLEIFTQKFSVVLKPLYSYGGKGIIKISGSRVSIEGRKDMSMDTFRDIYLSDPVPYLGMKYLKNVSLGDKRIVVAGGRILSASLRMPAQNSWICNISMGGSAKQAQVDKTEESIVSHIDPILRNKGIFIYGLDTLVNDNGERVISEINTLSVGGLSPADQYSGKSVTGEFADLLVKYTREICQIKST